MHIKKEKLPKGMSYPLQSSVLQLALEHAGITADVQLNYHQNDKRFFDAYFWPPNPNVDCERFYIVIGMIPQAEARTAKGFVETSVLPDFISWAEKILALPHNSSRRQEEQMFGRNFSAV